METEKKLEMSQCVNGKQIPCYPVTKAEYVIGLNDLQGGESTGSSSSKKYATFVIGTSTSGHKASDCDYLCDGVNDDIEINQAIQDLPEAGGKILILEGTYVLSGDITINKNNVTIEGMGTSTVIDRNNKTTNKYCIYINSCTHTQIKNLKLIHAEYGINVYKSNYTSIVSNVTSDNKTAGIILDYSNNNTVNSNIAYENITDDTNWASTEIFLFESHNNILNNNICSKNTDAGIYLYNSKSNKLIGNSSSECFFGIVLNQSNNNVLIANTCNSCEESISQENNSNGNIIENNITS